MSQTPSNPSSGLPANNEEARGVYRTTLISMVVVFFLLWFVIPLFVPGASLMIYTVTLPFRNLGIFVHEMGHGLSALLTGGKFYWFQMEMMQGGVAITSGGVSAVTLLGGLLGPSLAGAALLVASTRLQNLKWAMGGLIAFFAVGVYYMIKPIFMSAQTYPFLNEWSSRFLLSLVIPVGGILITWFLMKQGDLVQRLYMQLLGILMLYSGYSDTSYVFMYEQLDNGLYSDSRMVASLLWGSPESVPYWMFVIVAGGITVINMGLIGYGVWRAVRK